MNAKFPVRRKLAALALALPCVATASGLNFTPLGADPLGANAGMARPGLLLPGDGQQPSCGAGAAPDQAVGVVEVVDLAMCHNPQLRAAWAAVKQQAGALGEARAAYLPTLSVNVNRLRTDSHAGGQNETVTGNTLYGSLNWQIYDFGQRAANEQAADDLLRAALASNDAALQKNLADTIQAYFDVQSARATWHAKQLGATTATATLASAQRRESNGVLARSDRLQAATALARAQLDQNRAYGNYQKAMALLVYVMGLPPQRELVLLEDDEDDGASALAMQLDRLEQWLSTAQQAHPAIRAARAEWEAARSHTAAVRAENKPSVALSGNVYTNGYPGQGISATASQVRTVGITLNIPLFDGYAHRYKVQGAEAQAEQKEQALADTEHRILMEVVKVHADATAALRNLQASQTLMDAAQESMRTYERKYERGASDIIEILAAQTALADAREQRIICVSEWRSARLRLMADSGVLGRHSILDSTLRAEAPSR